MFSKITSKGQITLPKPIRDYLELHAGDKVEFIIDKEGRVVLSPKTVDIEELFGSVSTQKKVSIEEMDKAVKERMKKRYKHDRD